MMPASNDLQNEADAILHHLRQGQHGLRVCRPSAELIQHLMQFSEVLVYLEGRGWSARGIELLQQVRDGRL